MDISDIIKQTVLSSNYTSLSLRSELEKAQEKNLVHLKNDILQREINKLKYDPQHTGLDEAIQLKYNEIEDYLTASSLSTDTISDTIHQVQKNKVELIEKRAALSRKLTNYVKTALELLDVTWLIIEEFKVKYNQEKNIQFGQYYAALVDTLLIKVKTLHVTVSLNTYQDQDFTHSLENLSNLLEKRFLDAQKGLEYINKKIEEYKEIGPEFKTLCEAYQDLLEKIQRTKDDINRMS